MADGDVIAYSVRLFHLCPVRPRNVISLGTDRSEPLEAAGSKVSFLQCGGKGWFRFDGWQGREPFMSDVHRTRADQGEGAGQDGTRTISLRALLGLQLSNQSMHQANTHTYTSILARGSGGVAILLFSPKCS
jgi:hypothetical protein